MLGERDGEWQKATGVCVSYFTVAFVAGIIVIVIMDVTLPANGKGNQNDRWYEVKSS